MTVADRQHDRTWRIIDHGGHVTKAGSAEEAKFILACEWVRNSFDGEKTFRKTSNAEYTVRFGRKT